jgi:hypothetical protein
MERGKEICKALKEIRRQIALANDIEYFTSECKHRGNCLGTCPKCEQEVRYLEEQLESRRRLGKVTRVVGLSIGLAAIAPVLFTSCEPKDGEVEPVLQGDPVIEQPVPPASDNPPSTDSPSASDN